MSLSGRSPRWAPRYRWWVTFVLELLLVVIWSLATPLFASPDEPAHIVKGVAVVRGEWLGVAVTPAPGSPYFAATRVSVPRSFAVEGHPCYAFKPDTPASCLRPLASSDRTVDVATSSGRYPPLYYLLVGLPSLWWHSSAGVRLMRILGAIFSSLFLASALDSTLRSRHSGLFVWGVAFAATPMTMFLAGTVNPNGLEGASAICLFASGIALMKDDATFFDRRLLARVGISAAVLAQMPAVSLLWLALIVLCLAVLAFGERRMWRSFLSQGALWVWAGIVTLSCGFALWWAVHFDTFAALAGASPTHYSLTKLFETGIGQSASFVQQMIGVLGWLDTQPPFLTLALWLSVVVVLGALGFLTGTRRAAALIAALVGAVVAVPVLLEVSKANTYGFFWQGRYTLPLAVGIPILAASVVPTDASYARLTRRASGLLGLALVFSEGAIFLDSMRRYTIGLAGSLDFFGGPWHPPLGTVALTVGFLVVVVLYALWLGALAMSPVGDVAGVGRRSRGPSAPLPFKNRV